MSSFLADALRKTYFAYTNNEKAHNLTRADRLQRRLTSDCQVISVVDDGLRAVGETTKGSQYINSLTSSLKSTETTSKLLEYANKGAKLASKAVNPILCVAAGARAWADEDKKSALIEESAGMLGMFAVEGAIKSSLGLGGKVATYTNSKVLTGMANWGKNLLASCKWLNKIPTNRLTGIVKAAIFVVGSCLAFEGSRQLAKSVTKNTTRKDFEMKKLQAEQAQIAKLTLEKNGNITNYTC